MIHILADIIGAILLLCGALTEEELGESEVERFYHYLEHPVRINQAPRSRLLSCGLFNAYQVAALQEYRRRSGDILGATELGLVDGIGPERGEALAYFVSFDSSLPPGSPEDRRVRAGVETGGGMKNGNCGPVGRKYHLELGERAQGYLSARGGGRTLSLACYGRRGGSVIVGDFAARFGQGLALWSSFSMSGLASVSSFRRNATGFSATGSYSPSLSGVAVECPLGAWAASAAVSVPALRSALKGAPASDSEREVMPILFLSRSGLRGEAGLLAFVRGEGGVASASGILGLGHWTLFGEASLSSAVVSQDGARVRKTRGAAVGGFLWSPAYKVNAAAVARYYPEDYYGTFAGAVRSASKVSDEMGVSAGGMWRWVQWTLDAAFHPSKGTRQYKSVANLTPVFKWGPVDVAPALRWTESFKPLASPSSRHELRSDLKCSTGPFAIGGRIHVVRSRGWGSLAYVEAGFKTGGDSTRVSSFSAFVRAASFAAPQWADRIYCYERDVPGAFTVPAVYGRGYNLYAVLGASGCLGRRKPGRPLSGMRHGLYLKFSMLRSDRKKSDEIKLLYRWSL